jgi:threonine/homoserine/homoserine lactone efflux protein
MPTLHTLVTFALVSAGIMLLPGPSNFFLLAHGIAHGRRAALAATTGVEVASAVRVLLTAAGLSAVLAASPVALGVVRWAGALYLAYLGFRSFRSRNVHPDPHAGAAVPLRRSMTKGLVIGLANPKMMVFFLAFFPQFIDPTRGSQVTQILMLGAIFWVIGVAWDLGFAFLAATIGTWLQRHPHVHAAQPRVEGAAYISLASWAALAGA